MYSDPTMTTHSCGVIQAYARTYAYGTRYKRIGSRVGNPIRQCSSPAHHRDLSSAEAEPYRDLQHVFLRPGSRGFEEEQLKTYRRQKHSPELGVVEQRGGLMRRGHLRWHPVGRRRPLGRLIGHVRPSASSSSSSPCREIVVATAR